MNASFFVARNFTNNNHAAQFHRSLVGCRTTPVKSRGNQWSGVVARLQRSQPRKRGKGKGRTAKCGTGKSKRKLYKAACGNTETWDWNELMRAAKVFYFDVSVLLGLFTEICFIKVWLKKWSGANWRHFDVTTTYEVLNATVNNYNFDQLRSANCYLLDCCTDPVIFETCAAFSENA